MTEKQAIMTAVRVRPLLPTQKYNDQNCITTEGNKLTVTASPIFKQFDIPLLFSTNSTQQQVFQTMVQPLAEDLFRGFSCAFVCCGQNGSGKSYTIEGGESQETKGVVDRLIDYMAFKFETPEQSERTNLLRVSYVDIYQEQIIDLLEVRRGKEPKLIEKGREVQLSGVGFKHVRELNDLEDFFVLGNRKRRFAYKKNRRNPEKTTSIFSIYLESCSKQNKLDLKKGKFHIVDMSASKVNPTPLRNHYDLSTNALWNVTHALVYGQNQAIKVPYHDSKVTLFLREFLGGFGRANVLFHLSPAAKNVTASLENIRMVKTMPQIENYPDCQADPTQMVILKRLQELEETRQKLKKVGQQKKRLKEESENIPEEEENDHQNEFLSKEFLRKKKIEELQHALQRCSTQQQVLKKKLQNLNNLFLHNEPKASQNQKRQLQRSQQYNYRSQHLKKQDFSQKDISQQNRSLRQQIFQLQKQFQDQRQTLLNRIRQLQKQYQFYHRISQQTVKKTQLDIIRHGSVYDQTKRSYQVPQFAITNKKLSVGNRFYSPSFNQSMGRSFKISARSQQFPSPSGSKISDRYGVREIKTGFDQKKVEIAKRKPEKKEREKIKSECIEEDYYELGSHKDKKLKNRTTIGKSSSSSSNLFKHLSRLKFK